MAMITLLTDELIEVLVACIRKHMTLRLAANYAGVHETTFLRWRQQGAEDLQNNVDSVFARLCMGLKKAEGESAQVLLERVDAAGETPERWNANTWLLERRHRQDYGQQGDAIEKLTERVEQLAARIEKRSKGANRNGGEEKALDSECDKKTGLTQERTGSEERPENSES